MSVCSYEGKRNIVHDHYSMMRSVIFSLIASIENYPRIFIREEKKIILPLIIVLSELVAPTIQIT